MFCLCVRCWQQVKVTYDHLYKTKVYQRSKTQGRVKTCLKRLVKPVLEEVYFPWARNPDTEAMLPYDFYIPSLSLVIEVQGAEHYEYIPHFHGTQQRFQQRLLLDHIKESLAEDNDFNYLAIDGRVPITQGYITAQLQGALKNARFRSGISIGQKLKGTPGLRRGRRRKEAT